RVTSARPGGRTSGPGRRASGTDPSAPWSSLVGDEGHRARPWTVPDADRRCVRRKAVTNAKRVLVVLGGDD
ncbi:hypothetical protein, partial [Streptomyces sp. bgisy082]|uniref:hypothetical protein n=1 Tax=Streptomyces sp. bgisy082 TaxID=3413776 RepID=UPI003D75D190